MYLLNHIVSRISFFSIYLCCLFVFMFGGFSYSEENVDDILSVKVENHSIPEVCAEKDNIDLRFFNNDVRKFNIEAVHPAYISMVREDLAPPDFSDCDMKKEFSSIAKANKISQNKPRQVTLYETPFLWVTGQIYPDFWRSADVPVKIGDRVEKGLHLIQVWKRVGQRAEEMLVVYPPDGYWRARPLPPSHMGWSAYGSSFLVGPVTIEGRPVVAFNEISFDPDAMTFHFSFKAGGEGSLKMDELDQEHIKLSVELKGDLPKDKPFSSLRSMYVTETNNDVARVAWREKGKNRQGEVNILDYQNGEVLEFWAGRHVPSRHNLSSPDMVFSNFVK